MTRPDAKIPDEDPTSLADYIRDAARDSGMSVYRISRESGVDQSTLNKFLAGTRDNLTLEVADRLFRVLGLRVARSRRPAAGKARPSGPPGGE
jgi:transcriptional regulator with XRE-family HTH domain